MTLAMFGLVVLSLTLSAVMLTATRLAYADPAARTGGWDIRADSSRPPRDLAAELAPELDAGRPWAAVVLREQRASPRDPRSGLTMLLAPGDSIALRTRARRRH
jgi:hypothetical protein